MCGRHVRLSSDNFDGVGSKQQKSIACIRKAPVTSSQLHFSVPRSSISRNRPVQVDVADSPARHCNFVIGLSRGGSSMLKHGQMHAWLLADGAHLRVSACGANSAAIKLSFDTFS